MESSVLIESDGVVEIESCTFSDITRSILNATVVHTTSEKGSVSVTQEKFLSCFGGSEERWVELTDGNQTALAQTSWRQFVLASDSERMDEIDNTAYICCDWTRKRRMCWRLLGMVSWYVSGSDAKTTLSDLVFMPLFVSLFHLLQCLSLEGTTRMKEQQDGRSNKKEGTTGWKEQQDGRSNKKEGTTRRKEQRDGRNNKNEGTTRWKEQWDGRINKNEGTTRRNEQEDGTTRMKEQQDGRSSGMEGSTRMKEQREETNKKMEQQE
ncbi:hypothetical protein BLNAU_23436 [Blattamonas nauphoetae]|uniref:Uncharacterized protein n=1 Tax=Blattamonas nauphoetae TaxID=2049346 RepID=A0ABQ9WQ97_9EUKA|nr:hypothetical protein BLNAU_23436 [Blattamonas nauphoetae]